MVTASSRLAGRSVSAPALSSGSSPSPAKNRPETQWSNECTIINGIICCTESTIPCHYWSAPHPRGTKPKDATSTSTMIVPSASSQISRLVCVSMDRLTLKDMDRSRGRGSGAPRRQQRTRESAPKGGGFLSVTESAPDADRYGDESDANP